MKYLNISLDLGKVLELAEQAKQLILEGKNKISIAAFENNKRTSLEAPQYVANGIAVWNKEKTEESTVTEENI